MKQRNLHVTRSSGGRSRSRLQLGVVGLLLIASAAEASSSTEVTVPITVDHARVIVAASFARPDGTRRDARLWIDTGNPDWTISQKLAQDIGLDLTKPPTKDDSYGKVHIVAGLICAVGEKVLDSESMRAIVPVGTAPVFGGINVEGNLPSTLLQSYDIVLDYVGCKFTVANPGTLQPEGLPLHCRVNKTTGLVAFDAVIAGRECSLALDNGASFTLLAEDLIQQISDRQLAGLQQINGAIGLANMFGFPGEPKACLYKIPNIIWDKRSFGDVGALAMPKKFIDWYSRKTPGPVAGLIGGNVLRDYRVQINFSSKAIYFANKGTPDPHEMELIGLVLRPDPGGSFTIIGKADAAGVDPAPDLKVGDKLLKVDDVSLAHLTLGQAVTLLRGQAGQKHVLLVGREGQTLIIEARVLKYW